MGSLCATVASLVVCWIASLHDGQVSFWITAVYALLFFGASVLFYRWFTTKCYGLFLSLLLCFVLRLVFVFVIKLEPFSDFRLYHGMASAIANGQPLFSQYGAVFPHTVGFSWVISLVYRLFGEHPIFIQLFNVLAETLTAYLLYLSCNEFFGNRVGILTSFLYGISPAFIFYSELSATEIPFTLLLSLLLYLIILYTKKKKMRYAVLFGILAAVGNAIRPMGFLLLLVFGLYSICFLSGIRRFFAVFATIFCYLIVWESLWHGISFVNGQEIAKAPVGYNLYIGSNYEYSGKWNPTDYAYANELIYRENLPPDFFHQTLQREAVLRYQKNGIRKNLELFLQKFSVLWGSEMLPCDYLNRSGEFARVNGFSHQKRCQWLPLVFIAECFNGKRTQKKII